MKSCFVNIQQHLQFAPYSNHIIQSTQFRHMHTATMQNVSKAYYLTKWSLGGLAQNGKKENRKRHIRYFSLTMGNNKKDVKRQTKQESYLGLRLV